MLCKAHLLAICCTLFCHFYGTRASTFSATMTPSSAWYEYIYTDHNSLHMTSSLCGALCQADPDCSHFVKVETQCLLGVMSNANGFMTDPGLQAQLYQNHGESIARI
jgi:hypothetical protein